MWRTWILFVLKFDCELDRTTSVSQVDSRRDVSFGHGGGFFINTSGENSHGLSQRFKELKHYPKSWNEFVTFSDKQKRLFNKTFYNLRPKEGNHI